MSESPVNNMVAETPANVESIVSSVAGMTDIDIGSNLKPTCNLTDATESDQKFWAASVYGSLGFHFAVMAGASYRVVNVNYDWLADNWWLILLIAGIFYNTVYVICTDHDVSRMFPDRFLLGITLCLSSCIMISCANVIMPGVPLLSVCVALSGFSFFMSCIQHFMSAGSKRLYWVSPLIASAFWKITDTFEIQKVYGLPVELYELPSWANAVAVISTALISMYIARVMRKMLSGGHRFWQIQSNEKILSSVVILADIFDPLHHICGLKKNQ